MNEFNIFNLETLQKTYAGKYVNRETYIKFLA